MTDTHPGSDADDVRRVLPRSANWPEDGELVRRLFADYRDWVGDHADPAPASRKRVSDGLALLDRLIADLPGAYRPPHGDILLWFSRESVVACGALREMESGVGEIRRVYIRADYRGGEFGRPFVRALVARAREFRFGTVRADTLPTMRGAIEFYHDLGFRPVAAFWPHPAAGVQFFERTVDPETTDLGTRKKRQLG